MTNANENELTQQRDAMVFPTCFWCDGTMTKVSENEAVCTNDEGHRRKIKFVGFANVLPFDNAGGLSLALYDGID